LNAPLQRRVSELDLAKRVSFPGWVGDPGAYIAGEETAVLDLIIV